MIYSFGSFELDTERFELRRDGTPVAIEPQVFDVLAYLVQHRERLVSKNELLDNVWGDRFVSDSALTTRIKAARRALDDDGQRQLVIRTHHGRGYRFTAHVREGADVDRPAGPELGQPDDGTAPARPTTAPVAIRAPTWPVVGRARELELIANWFTSAATGGVLLTGDAGLGKTRLAEECLRLAVEAGLPVARATGHAEARSIPFAALAHLLPDDLSAAVGADGELDRAAVFHRARAWLGEQAAGRRLMLLIDDTDQLDDLSRALISSLVQSRTVFAALTMRTSGGPTPLDHLLKDGQIRRLDLAPLTTEAIETLMHRVLGGPLVAESLERLGEAAGGNPGMARQLVERALEDGSLVEHDGVWRLTAPLRPPASLEDVVEERLSGLDDERRHAAELLAVAGQLALEVLRPVVGDDVLEELERRGLLSVRQSERRLDVTLAHPLFAEVLLRQLPVLRSRRLRRQLADRLEAVGARRRDDRFRLVAWRLEGGGEVDSALVLEAARLALLDGNHDVAERLIRRAQADGAGVGAVQLRAELHFRRGEPAEVERVLAGVELGALDQSDRARVIRRRSGNLFYGLTDPDGTLRVFAEAAQLVTEPRARRSVRAQQAILLTMIGQVAEALQCVEPLDGGDDIVRFETLRAHSLALAAAGRGNQALALIAEGRRLYERFDADLSRPGRTILLFNELLALTELGRLDEARTLARGMSGPVHRGGLMAWLALARPRIELASGHAVAALRAGESYAMDSRALGLVGAERWVLSLVGMARLLTGDLQAGRRDIGRVAYLWPQDTGLFRSDRDRALAWLAAEEGDLASAREVLQARAANAAARGAFALEAVLLHDVVRFGGARAAVDRLGDLARQVGGEFTAARAQHALGVTARDPARLAAAVAAFERIGSPLLAAEAELDLAAALGRPGHTAEATDAANRSRRLLDRLDGPVTTPILRRDGI